ncbi:MAG: class I adenylate-forming enzyme family protein [Frankiaceae bacterium]
MTTLLQHYLRDNARTRPDKTALVCDGARLSYAELDAAANRLAHGLLAAGVRPGDRVVVHLENSFEAVIAIFAILRAGAVFSVVHPATKAERLSYILQDEAAAALITINDARRRPCVLQALRAAPVSVVIWVNGPPVGPGGTPSRDFLDWAAMAAESGCTPEVGTSDLDLASIIYTSGPTAHPKGVMSAHRDTVFAARSIAGYLDNTADDVIFCCLPLAHTYGLSQLLTATLVGATVVLQPNFAFPARALQVMARERVTGFPGVPTMFAVLLRQDRLVHHDLSSLRYFTNAAAPLPAAQLLAVCAAFPQVQFFSMYGQTECKRACYLPPEQLCRRPDSVGIPIPGTDAYVVDEDGRPAPPGVTGELVVRGPHLMRGYWGKPQDTAARLRRGPAPGELLLYTGDLFRTDAAGFLYFVSRADDIIKCRGEKVSPQEIETALCRLDGVADVAAVGVPDDILGEAIKVVVVRKTGAALSELDVRAFCSRQLEDSLIPKYVEFRSELPTNDHGKTLRRELRTCAA